MKKISILIMTFLLLMIVNANATITWSPTDKNASITLSNGNMTATSSASSWVSLRTTEGKNSGKWYFEIYVNTSGTYLVNGIGTSSASLSNYPGGDDYGWGYGKNYGYKYHSGSLYAYGNTYTVGDIIGIAIDMDTGAIWFAKNNVWQASGDPAAGTGAAFTGITGTVFPMTGFNANGDSVTLRVGSSDCLYSPPTGFLYLNPVYRLSGTLKEHESDTSGKAYEYLLLDATNHTIYAYSTADSAGAWSEEVANLTDEYCGVMLDNLNGLTYSGDWGTTTTDASGNWSITNANWASGDNVWCFFVDPDKVYKTIAAKFNADASNTVSGVHQENGSPASGTIVYAAGFGTTAGTYDPKPFFDFATGSAQ